MGVVWAWSICLPEIEMDSKGWKLSPEGVAACRELCKERGLSENGKSLSKVALDLDLRATGEPTLPEITVHSEPVKIQGPLVLQVQKVKNVAVSSGKQHQPSPSKRLLKLLLTDGHRNISAAETDGPVEKLGPTTPPGTKIVLTGSITVVNGFILLKKSSVEVLGGSVEPLLKKWKVHQTLPDNLERARADGESGPPQFMKFGQRGGLEALAASVRARKEAKKEDRIRSGQSRPSPPAAESAPTRTLMDLPPSYRAQSGEGDKTVVKAGSKAGGQAAKRGEDLKRQTDTRGSREIRPKQAIEEDAMDYVPPSRPSDSLLGDYFQKLSLNSAIPATNDIEDLGKCANRGREQGSGRGRGGGLREDTRGRGRSGFADHYQERGEGRTQSEGRRGRGEQPESGTRGRGRGRRREREDQDGYYPQRQKNSYQLSDFLTARNSDIQEAPKRPKEDDVLKDYEYDPVSDSYHIKQHNFQDVHPQDHARASSGAQPRRNDHGRHAVNEGNRREEEKGSREYGRGERREYGRERRHAMNDGNCREEEKGSREYGRGERREYGRERREHGSSRDNKDKGDKEGREPGVRGDGPRQDGRSMSYYEAGQKNRMEQDRGKGARERGRGRIEHSEGYAGERRGEGRSGGRRDRGGQRNLENVGRGSAGIGRHGSLEGSDLERNNRTHVKENRKPPADNVEDLWGHLTQTAGGVPFSAKKC